jgi:hypothetical protein
MKDFDDLIRAGRDTDAMRYLAQEYYNNGKMGHTRKLLLERVADKLDTAAVEKQVPKRVKYIERCASGLSTGFCGVCEAALCSNSGEWCARCGQKLDWRG